MERRGPLTETQLLSARVRKYLRATGFRVETIGEWERTDNAFAYIEYYTEAEYLAILMLFTDSRNDYLRVAAEEVGKIYIEIDWTVVRAARAEAAR